jgi:N-acetylmuramoyl-L-alanine amidase
MCGFGVMVRAALRIVTFNIAFIGAMLLHIEPSSSEPKTATKQTAAPVAPVKIPGRGVVALDARLAGDEKRTRLIVDLSKKVDISVFTLANPARVIVDLPDVSFDLPASAGRAGRGVISAYRYGLIGPGKARIVLDAMGPVKIEKSFVQEEFDDQPARLVVDLVRTDAESFKTQAAVQKPIESVAAAPPAERKNDRETPPPPSSKLVVVIDPGHGGIDSGAKSIGGEDEKDIVLSAAQKLSEKLEKTGRYKVVMTRSDDTFVALGERVKVARANQAALFISLHADYIPKREGDARGATIYTVSDRASDAEAARLAEKENKADLIAGLDLSKQSDDIVNILYDLTHRETKNFSSLFQRTIVGQMKSGGVLMHQDAMRSAGFVVLKAPDVPSVLVELGYLSNAEDIKNLTSDAWRDKVADSIANSVQSFFASRSSVAAAR